MSKCSWKLNVFVYICSKTPQLFSGLQKTTPTFISGLPTGPPGKCFFPKNVFPHFVGKKNSEFFCHVTQLWADVAVLRHEISLGPSNTTDILTPQIGLRCGELGP